MRKNLIYKKPAKFLLDRYKNLPQAKKYKKLLLLLFLKNQMYYYLHLIKYLNLNNYMKILKFSWFNFSLFLGLGYKRRVRNRIIYIYIGDRHWLIIKLSKKAFFIPIKKRNIVTFSEKKKELHNLLVFFSNMKKESVFKLKGFIRVRTKKRWLFARRLKLRKIKIKLSKKQKLI